MTDKLYCPFCGAELKNACAQVIYFCPNDKCHKAKDWYASKQVWQALIDGKKAQGEIKKLRAALQEIIDNPHGAACHNYQRAKKALEV